MEIIEDLDFDSEHLTWFFNGERVCIEEKGVTQVLEDRKRGLVFALIGPSEEINLHIFSRTGRRLSVFPPPQHFTFSYITTHPEIGVAVVGGANERVEGWYDWHFGFKESEKELFRHCPAY